MDNYYILLELSFDPPVTDPATIKDALHKKKQEWTRAQDNPAKRGSALRWLNMAPEIERVMLDPVQRMDQAKAAQALRETKLREFEAELRILEGKGYLLPREVSAIAVKYKAYGIDKETVSDSAKCPITDAPPQNKMQVEPQEVLDKLTARNIRRNLEVLDCEDLYAFLEEQPYSSIKKLTDAAQNKRKTAQAGGSKTAVATAAQELAGICNSLFADFTSKQRYDQYLKVSKYPALNDLIEEEYNRSQYLSPAILLRLINFAVERYGVKVLEAEDYIRRYCIAYDIPIDSKSPKIPCPACGVAMPREGQVCTACGAPLTGECPGCGTPFGQGAAICADCGFALKDMVKALQYIDDAQKALIDNNWGTAQRNVQYAKKYWPGHPQIEPLEKRSRSLEDRYAWYVDNIADAVRHNQYYAAQELIEEAEARRMRLPLSSTRHVAKVIDDFEKRLEKLEQDPPFEKILELTLVVEDSLELSRMMAKHPPQPPKQLTVIEGGRFVRLSWGKSPSPGLVEYVLVRKRGSLPLTALDGDVLYDGPANSFVDKTAESLTEYYYSLYAKRQGTFSQEYVSAGPLLSIPEVEGLQILPCDQGAQLTWDFNQDMREVIIWRKLGGDRPTAQGEGIRLENPRIDGYLDHKIKNDVEYWYYLVASYVVDGKKIYAKGVSDSVTPRKLIAPIEDLAVMPTGNQEDEYVVNWRSSQYNDVLLLASPKKPDLHSGDVVPVQQLLAGYRKLELDAKQADSARFHYAFGGGVYIFAAALFGKFATIGQSVYLTNVRNVENPTYDVMQEELYINMKWPPGVTEVLLTYRFDRYPNGPNDLGAASVRVTKEQYEYDAGVVIREPEPTVYYIKIFSTFLSPDQERYYSQGVELLANNTVQQEIFYTLSYKKPPFAKQGTLSINLASQDPALLPPAVVVGKIGRLPLNKSDGVSLLEFAKETKIHGELTYQYKLDALPKDLYIRMFLYDDSQYDRVRLLPQDSVRLT